MSGLDDLGRTLVLIGILVVVVGLVVLAAGRIPFLGHLPGDIRFRSGGLSCVVPLATSLLVSVLLSILLTVVANLLQRR